MKNFLALPSHFTRCYFLLNVNTILITKNAINGITKSKNSLFWLEL